VIWFLKGVETTGNILSEELITVGENSHIHPSLNVSLCLKSRAAYDAARIRLQCGFVQVVEKTYSRTE